MKKLLILTLLICAVAAVGFAQTKKKISRLKKNPASAKIKSVPAKDSKNMNGQMTLALQEQSVDDASKIKITFVEVMSDSRCPEGVNCFWAGSARVKISVSKDGAAEQIFELETNLEPHFAVYQGYTISLTDLSPYPKNKVEICKAEIRAQLTITKGSNAGIAI